MAQEGRKLVKEAIEDAKSLKAAAVEKAKNELVESLAPGLKAMLDKQVRSLFESGDRTREQGADYYSPATREKQKRWEESKDKGEKPMADKDDMKDLDMESISAFFPGLSEMEGDEEGEKRHSEPDGDEGMEAKVELEDEATIPTLGEADDMEGDMDEDVEISEAEIKKFYEQALQTEVKVKGAFSDMSGGGELEDAAKDTGILDKKSGETEWDDVEPPAKQKFVPESIQKLIRQGLAENKALRKQNAQLKAVVKEAVSKLHEVNLFNNKVLHVNRLLNKHSGLTKEQKRHAIESLDKAASIKEVKTIYETIDGSFKALSEGRNPRKPVANAQRARTSGAADQKVVRESVDRSGGSAGNDRWKRLAGLVK